MEKWNTKKPPVKRYESNGLFLYELSHTYNVIVKDKFNAFPATYYEDKEKKGWFALNDYENQFPINIIAWWNEPTQKNY